MQSGPPGFLFLGRRDAAPAVFEAKIAVCRKRPADNRAHIKISFNMDIGNYINIHVCIHVKSVTSVSICISININISIRISIRINKL